MPISLLPTSLPSNPSAISNHNQYSITPVLQIRGSQLSQAADMAYGMCAIVFLTYENTTPTDMEDESQNQQKMALDSSKLLSLPSISPSCPRKPHQILLKCAEKLILKYAHIILNLLMSCANKSSVIYRSYINNCYYDANSGRYKQDFEKFYKSLTKDDLKIRLSVLHNLTTAKPTSYNNRSIKCSLASLYVVDLPAVMHI